MRFIFGAAVLAGLASCLPSAKLIVHEKRNGDPHDWVKVGEAAKDQKLPVRVGLKQQNLDNMYKYVTEVSDPQSPNFGKHWTREEIAKKFAPTEESAKKAVDWLVSSGVSNDTIIKSAGLNWIEFNSTVKEVEKLFNTTYYDFKHKQSGGLRTASDEYSLPASISAHIDFVMPTIQLDGLKPMRNPILNSKPTKDLAFTHLNGTADCHDRVTIDCLRHLYKLPINNSSHPYNQLGIPEWADYLYLPDLKKFFKYFTKPTIPSSVEPEFISIDGGKKGDHARVEAGQTGESALDFMTAYSIIYPQNTRLYQVGDGVNVDSVGTFNIFLDALDKGYCTYQGGDQPYIDPAYPDPNDGGYTGPLQCGGAPMSNVFSVSYGQIEASLPQFYQQRQCNEWGKLALMGVSIIFASGDSGVANRYNAGYPDTCLDPTGNFIDPNGKRFSPGFPVNCPYVTSVGGTTLLTENIDDGERAVDQFGSGGGFSSLFPRPDYQKEAVQQYLDKYSPNYGPEIFNSTGRAFPDVAAIGQKVVVVNDDSFHTSGGTSVSAPIFASVITLLNEERLADGKGPIGFLNPIIYKHPEIFNDVTIGNNPGCGTQGFPASPGWDPVTGMGTPNFPKMRELFNKLP